MRLAQLAAWAGGELKGADRPVAGISTDSRMLREGDLFVALAGERFDGHDFAADCAAQAAGVLVARELSVPCPQIIVPETLAALQAVAQAWRRQCGDVALAAVTGSNGKTSTREMTAAILASHGPTAASPGNWNNHVGVPLTLLQLMPQHRYAVVEMGANHPGEIRRLTRLAEPQAAAITCAAEAHLEGFGNVAGVARAKAEIFEGLQGDGMAVINAEDAYAEQWRRQAASCDVMTFAAAVDVPADVVALPDAAASLALQSAGETVRIDWMLEGTHNARNAACAVALACALGLEFRTAAQALAGFELPVDGRLRFLEGLHGAQLVDDSYNANPGSFRAAIDVLSGLPQEPWLVMGEMMELGPRSGQCHEDVACYARAAGVRRLYALGTHAERCARAFGAGAQAFASLDEAAAVLQAHMHPDCAVLVKGSRGAQLERLVAKLASGRSAHAA